MRFHFTRFNNIVTGFTQFRKVHDLEITKIRMLVLNGFFYNYFSIILVYYLKTCSSKSASNSAFFGTGLITIMAIRNSIFPYIPSFCFIGCYLLEIQAVKIKLN